MPEIIFNGPEGRLEGRYQPGKSPTAPVALILHPDMNMGGNMNNKAVYYLFHAFAHRGFATLRFNFRGVGRSVGDYDEGIGELSDAASALDWLQSINPNSTGTWVAGSSFGAWIAMQLLMRRPEIQGFIAVTPPANMYDFSFLAPCPSSGIIVQAEQDDMVTSISVQKLVEKLKTQKAITIDHEIVPGATHFFDNKLEELMKVVNQYLNSRLTAPK